MNKTVVISFSRAVLRVTGGLEKPVFLQLIQALPSDAKIVGFKENVATDEIGLLVESESYKEVPSGQFAPSVIAQFRKEANGSVSLVRLDYEDGSSAPVGSASCLHSFEMYSGLNTAYEYCKFCGEPK